MCSHGKCHETQIIREATIRGLCKKKKKKKKNLVWVKTSGPSNPHKWADTGNVSFDLVSALWNNFTNALSKLLQTAEGLNVTELLFVKIVYFLVFLVVLAIRELQFGVTFFIVFGALFLLEKMTDRRKVTTYVHIRLIAYFSLKNFSSYILRVRVCLLFLLLKISNLQLF